MTVKNKKNTVDVSILQEAADLIGGERREDYGPAAESFNRVADLWNIHLRRLGLEEPLEGHDVAMMMILFKLAREMNAHKRDNLVDIAGYAALADLV